MKKEIDDLIELSIAENIKTIIRDEISKLRSKAQLEEKDFVKLEKLAKTYSTMMEDLRENLKTGLYGKLGMKSLMRAEEVDKQAIRTKDRPQRTETDSD